MHKNLYNGMDSTFEAYGNIKKRTARVYNILFFLAWGVGACFSGAWKYGTTDGWPWLIGGIACAFVYLALYIEYSNADYHLHTIDWIAATRYDTQQSQLSNESDYD